MTMEELVYTVAKQNFYWRPDVGVMVRFYQC